MRGFPTRGDLLTGPRSRDQRLTLSGRQRFKHIEFHALVERRSRYGSEIVAQDVCAGQVAIGL